MKLKLLVLMFLLAGCLGGGSNSGPGENTDNNSSNSSNTSTGQENQVGRIIVNSVKIQGNQMSLLGKHLEKIKKVTISRGTDLFSLDVIKGSFHTLILAAKEKINLIAGSTYNFNFFSAKAETSIPITINIEEKIKEKQTDFNIELADNRTIFMVSGITKVNLPEASSVGPGFSVKLKLIDQNGYIHIDSGGNVIDGSSKPFYILSYHSTIELSSDGFKWWNVGESKGIMREDFSSIKCSGEGTGNNGLQCYENSKLKSLGKALVEEDIYLWDGFAWKKAGSENTYLIYDKNERISQKTTKIPKFAALGAPAVVNKTKYFAFGTNLYYTSIDSHKLDLHLELDDPIVKGALIDVPNYLKDKDQLHDLNKAFPNKFCHKIGMRIPTENEVNYCICSNTTQCQYSMQMSGYIHDIIHKDRVECIGSGLGNGCLIATFLQNSEFCKSSNSLICNQYSLGSGIIAYRQINKNDCSINHIPNTIMGASLVVTSSSGYRFLPELVCAIPENEI